MNGNRDSALDGLRGIAALAVVFSHVAAMTWNPFYDPAGASSFWQRALWHLGAPAVDLFLVLSGYVVAGSLLRSRTRYGEYIAGRLVRLYPIAWIAVLAGLALRSADLPIPQSMSAATAVIRQPLDTWDMIGLTNLIAPVPVVNRVNPPLWTLVLEMQAALIMPLLAWGARRDARILGLLSLFVPVLMVMALRFPYPYYFAGFGVGAALAGLERRIPPAPVPVAVLAVAMAGLLCRHYLDTEDPGLRVPCALAAAGVILAIRQGAARRLLETRAALWLGKVSYPLYATHWVVMAVSCMTIGFHVGVTVAALASIPVALVLAWALSVAVDRPATALSRLMRSRT